MAKGSPYPGSVCKCGHGLPPVWRYGRYRGLCELGQVEVLRQRKGREQYGGTLEPLNARMELRLLVSAALRQRYPWCSDERLAGYGVADEEPQQ